MLADTLRQGLANGPLESFSLVDLEGFGLEEVFPHAYSIAPDGSGPPMALIAGATELPSAYRRNRSVPIRVY